MRKKILGSILDMMNSCTPENMSALDWEHLIRVARASAVLSRLAINYQRKYKSSLPSFVVKQFEAINRHSELLKQQIFFEAMELDQHISKCSVQRAIFLKGAAYVLSEDEVGAGRIFSDIDILVKKADLPAIEKRLQAAMWFPDQNDENDQKYYREWAHEIPPLIKSSRGTVVDVHHNLIPPISGKAPDIALFLNEIRTVPTGYQVLMPHAMTLHSIIHLFYQEEFIHGYRDLSDLHLLVKANSQNSQYWTALLALAQKTQFCRELFYACRYLKIIFNTEIDPYVKETLANSGPHLIKLKVLDWMFTRVLLPRHRLINKSFTSLAHQLAFVRGHWLKMPFHILCIHSFNKLKFAVRHFFTGNQKVTNGANEI